YGGILPEKPVCITIDDGYLSNYEIAWPILKQYGMKATIFAIGSSVGDTQYYKDTLYPITPHFSYEEAEEMLLSGVIDLQSHTYDMHQWAPFETGDAIRSSMLPFNNETEEDYAEALYADMETYKKWMQQELGRDFCALAYPSGYYNELVEVLVHQEGIPVTLSTDTDSRNVLVRGLPQSLYALCRFNVTDHTTAEELLSYLEPTGFND
ncbi:MAG: polysaccharide deacetylase family protein, partial [Clostridia bacterium]|nr:polysaccharide deacetylase family protein [Clostridia bacterium]